MRLLRILYLLIVFVSVCDALRRRKRTWRRKEVSWSFRDPYNLLRSQQKYNWMRSIISTSFELWQNALGDRLRIVENKENGGKSDIDIHFARRDHGDIEALDGAGGMVAHSGLPPRGYLHLDADEPWSFDGVNGVDIRYVILHETGHLLGLRHTKRKYSIMNPYYRTLSEGMKLSKFDRQYIRRLYNIHHNHTQKKINKSKPLRTKHILE